MVKESRAAGSRVAEVARRHDVHPNPFSLEAFGARGQDSGKRTAKGL
jgi:transposase-like protein